MLGQQALNGLYGTSSDLQEKRYPVTFPVSQTLLHMLAAEWELVERVTDKPAIESVEHSQDRWRLCSVLQQQSFCGMNGCTKTIVELEEMITTRTPVGKPIRCRYTRLFYVHNHGTYHRAVGDDAERLE
jgi:uncharacterized damage-inducible protein DinB